MFITKRGTLSFLINMALYITHSYTKVILDTTWYGQRVLKYPHHYIKYTLWYFISLYISKWLKPQVDLSTSCRPTLSFKQEGRRALLRNAAGFYQASTKAQDHVVFLTSLRFSTPSSPSFRQGTKVSFS